MAKNYRVDFELIKARADFRAILAHYGLTPGRGVQFKILCPFHDDTEPSCSINTNERIFNCFGCGVSGNVLEFVHRMETRDGTLVSIRKAGIRLAEVCGIELGETGARRGARKPKDGPATPEAEKGPSTTAKASPDASGGLERPSGKKVEAKANKPLGFVLKVDPEHPYLAERGISRDLVERFGLGFCEKGIMAGRICIPIANTEGQTVAYAGRWVGKPEELPEGKGKYELPTGFHKELELFNLHRVMRCRHLVVVEGYFGAIRLHGMRIPAVALMGRSISTAQLELLSCANARHVTVLLDGDDAGRAAAGEVAGAIASVVWARTVQLPDGTQPDTVEQPELVRLLWGSAQDARCVQVKE